MVSLFEPVSHSHYAESSGKLQIMPYSQHALMIYWHSYYPQKIGDYVHVGSNTIIEAASIGNNVKIGKNCVIVG